MSKEDYETGYVIPETAEENLCCLEVEHFCCSEVCNTRVVSETCAASPSGDLLSAVDLYCNSI